MNHIPAQPDTTRQLRVFISSTFRDMQEDRDVLIKKIFPQLRKLCEERGVVWTEVDLRWGITTEEAAEGKVLPLCLEEIDRCRPYFIGLLGERYGWVPVSDSIPADLLEAQPWLKDHLHHSITELEILHGVLSKEQLDGRAYFYFRDPRYVESVPSAKRQDFTAENPESATKLLKLKQMIRAAHHKGFCQLREGYANPEQLGEWILEDFTMLIDLLFPKEQVPDALDQEAARHEAYARSRRLAFVGRDDLLRRLNEHAQAPGKPLIVTGESGSGKSALLAEWVARWRKDHPDDLIIQHYVSSTPDSADWQSLVRRILGELKRAFAISEEIPVQADALRAALNEWSMKVARSGRVVVVLDAIDQLGDDGTAQPLSWLPVDFPENFRLLLSSTSGAGLEILRKRGWPEISVPLFGRADIAPAARDYFKIFSKTPPLDLVEKLESTPAARNALYLRAVLDELRQFGKHDELIAKAGDYLSAPDLPELFDRIISRWENDFGADLVRQSLTLIWAARRGLSEVEILDLLGKQPSSDVFRAYSEGSQAELFSLLKEIREPRQPMPRIHWTPFFFAAENEFVMRAGLLTFSHTYLRAAVEKRYLPTVDARNSAHERLALYFEFSPLPAHIDTDGTIHFEEEAVATSRALDETPWQLQESCRWEALVNYLSFLPVFKVACATGRDFEWMQYWKNILSAVKKGVTPQVDIPGLYLAGFRQLSPDEKTLLGGTLGQFLYALGYLDAARECFEEEGKAAGFASDRFLRAGNLNDQGLIERDDGKMQEALKRFEEAEAILEIAESNEVEHVLSRDERRLLASILMNKASVVRDHTENGQGWSLLERALGLMRETTGERSPEVATVLQGMGNFAEAQGDFKGALSLHLQALAIRRDRLNPEHRDIGLSLGNIANTLAHMEHYHYAICFWERSLDILEKTLGEEHLLSHTVSRSLKQCRNIADQAMETESGFGLVLLVFNSLSPTENPLDLTTAEGARLVAQQIRDTMIEIWDNSLTNHNYIPLFVLSFPGYETASSLALKQTIVKRFPEGYLIWQEIPEISANVRSPAALNSFSLVKQQLLGWIQRHKLDVLMVKPVLQSGATLDRRLLEYCRRSFQDVPINPFDRRSARPGDRDRDLRPMVIEVVPFDQQDGPILGLYTGDRDPRPSIMPSYVWRQQNYSPQLGDQHATGVFYLNLAGTLHWLERRTGGILSRPGAGLRYLDEWSKKAWTSIATGAREDQLRLFESALSELVLLVKTRPVNCAPERGVRGFQPNDLYRDLEDLLG